MEIIPYEFIVTLQNEIDEMVSVDSQNRMKEVYLDQPNLTQYIVELNDDLDDEINKYVLYLFSVVYLSIKDYYQKSLPVISEKDIIKVHENNVDLLERLETSHEGFITKFAENNLSKQPGIYRFITESIFEDLREIFDDLQEDDEGWIFLVLKTTIDILNQKIN